MIPVSSSLQAEFIPFIVIKALSPVTRSAVAGEEELHPVDVCVSCKLIACKKAVNIICKYYLPDALEKFLLMTVGVKACRFGLPFEIHGGAARSVVVQKIVIEEISTNYHHKYGYDNNQYFFFIII